MLLLPILSVEEPNSVDKTVFHKTALRALCASLIVITLFIGQVFLLGASQDKPVTDPNTPNPCKKIEALSEAKTCWEKSAKRGDKNLKGANLEKANLEGAALKDVNLDGANLVEANLTDAFLWGGNFLKANLSGANLTEAFLYGADLTSANLAKANLAGADMEKADLRKAKLEGANLKKARMQGVSLKGAIMPDGQPYDKESNNLIKYGASD